MSNIEWQKRESETAEEMLDSIAGGINIYWERVLDSPKFGIWKITVDEPQPDGSSNQEVFTYDRQMEEAYCVGSARFIVNKLFGGVKAMEPKGEIEFILLPVLYNSGKFKLKKTDETGKVTEKEMFMVNLKEMDKEAMAALERAQINMVSMLVGRCRERDLFDPMVREVKDLVEFIYGPEVAKELWAEAMGKL